MSQLAARPFARLYRLCYRSAVVALELFVFDSQLGEVLLVLMEVTNFDQRRPKLERGVNDADHVVDNAGDVLLKKIWLKAVEATREIFGEKRKRLASLRVFRLSRRFEDLLMNTGNFLQDLLCVVKRDLAVVGEADGEVANAGNTCLDLFL